LFAILTTQSDDCPMAKFAALPHSGRTGRDSNIAALTGSHTAVAEQVS
jgi:hypothetical protein